MKRLLLSAGLALASVLAGPVLAQNTPAELRQAADKLDQAAAQKDQEIRHLVDKIRINQDKASAFRNRTPPDEASAKHHDRLAQDYGTEVRDLKDEAKRYREKAGHARREADRIEQTTAPAKK